ncbi:TetR/AcrR family transcriptional regulator [Sphingomonas sp. QA11]|uniref:TetR/AcrR family transcriptional regulator n=1 Tax=Sphingomonas sp. QA11 TaxID=2950605 RepID=UPI00234AEE13|nr:TetR/AcrR family transcriptional regulator [Sphingomonas sp. QA11]WCM28662.1 TetR/AcrR family transcriptional regulator [Sphingomonas sp. QA11]
MSKPDPASRPYASAKRSAKAAETREKLITAAAAVLRDQGAAALSLEAVASVAGVTRLTVYHQFGSRRGLLEALFDRLAEAGGMMDIASAMSAPDPRDSLAMLVKVFCVFWSSDDSLPGLYAVAGIDPELMEGLNARNARRRELLAALVSRFGGRDAAAEQDVIDILFALTGFGMFQSMACGGRSPDAVCTLLQALCDQTLAQFAI